MIKTLMEAGGFIGDTPLKRLNIEGLDTYAKLEYTNFTGSIKDRAAYNILYNAISNGKINKETKIVESSSGNFAVALSTFCNLLNLKFTAVIDPNINPLYEKRIRLLADDVIKVCELDETGGYLLNRIKKVKELCSMENNTFWTNQYENPDNYMAYYSGLGQEICAHFDSLDYLFVAVSSCGTITGLSKRLKEKFPDIKIIAVDVEGSVIFGNNPSKRHVSGLGSSKKPVIIKEALIDDIVHVSELNIVEATHDMLAEQSLFVGASTGASYWAIKNYFSHDVRANQKVLFLCHDSGYAYMNSIYNPDWVESLKSISLIKT